MRVLLDTHIMLWAFVDSPMLSPEARKMIGDVRSQIYFSSSSVWEVSIKHALAPEQMPLSGRDFLQYARQAGYVELPITANHAVEVEDLPLIHKDPFDRILVAQARSEPMRLLTHDRLLQQYGETVMLV